MYCRSGFRALVTFGVVGVTRVVTSGQALAFPASLQPCCPDARAAASDPKWDARLCRRTQKKARAQNREFRVFGIRGLEQSSFVELAYPKP